MSAVHQPDREQDAGTAPLLEELEALRARVAQLEQADAERRRAEEMFRSLLESAPDAMVIVNQRGEITLVNSQTERMFGYRREELIGQSIELLVPERYRERHVADRARYQADPQPRPMGVGQELFGRRKDGKEFAVEISLSPLKTSGGALVISAIRDTTERKRAESQLRQTEKRYRTLVEQIPAVTFMAALDGGDNALYVSPQIEVLLGFSQKEWLENPVLWHRQLHPDDRDRWNLEFAPTCGTGEAFRSVYRFIARDGRVVWVHGEAKVVLDDDGRPLFLQGVAFDITGMKEAEHELKTLNQTLEQRVAERTAAAEAWSKELERSNRDLEDYAYFVVHELKEPLRSINSWTPKLAREYTGKLDAAADDYIARINNAGRRMDHLVDMMLKYAKAGKEGKAPRLTDCTAVFAKACANLQEPIERSGARVTSGPLPAVPAVEPELVQVFQNLLSNAVKFRATEVQVYAERQGANWQIEVRDNGIGMKAEWMAKNLFIIFKRGESTREYPGSGIGLAFCKRVVEQHGGRIWAESELDKGSTFYFTLPAK